MTEQCTQIFTACKYLDFNDNYTARKQILGSAGKVFWMRDVTPDYSQMVQFCSKRGRLNHPEACLREEDKQCDLYENYEHTVVVPDP